MEFVKWWTCFKYLFTNSLFLIGQSSSFKICAISFPLSLFSLLQSYNRWSTLWLPLAQGHSGDSIILNRWRYDLVFPWAVTIAVNLGVKLIFISRLSLMSGKNSWVADPLVVLLPLSYALLSFLMLYFTFWDSVVAYVTVSGGLLSQSVSKFFSVVSCMCLFPGVFNVPVFFLQYNCLLSDFFYEMVSIFHVFEVLQCYPAVCMYLYCSWDVIVYFYCLYCLKCFKYCLLFCMIIRASIVEFMFYLVC